MTHPLLENALAQMERQLDAVSGALVQNDRTALESGCTALRMAAIAFSHAVEQRQADIVKAGRPFRQRIERVGQRLMTQRENLARRQAIMDRAVASILPPSDVPTYGGSLKSARGGGAARIYAALAN